MKSVPLDIVAKSCNYNYSIGHVMHTGPERLSHREQTLKNILCKSLRPSFLLLTINCSQHLLGGRTRRTKQMEVVTSWNVFQERRLSSWLKSQHLSTELETYLTHSHWRRWNPASRCVLCASLRQITELSRELLFSPLFLHKVSKLKASSHIIFSDLSMIVDDSMIKCSGFIKKNPAGVCRETLSNWLFAMNPTIIYI